MYLVDDVFATKSPKLAEILNKIIPNEGTAAHDVVLELKKFYDPKYEAEFIRFLTFINITYPDYHKIHWFLLYLCELIRLFNFYIRDNDDINKFYDLINELNYYFDEKSRFDNYFEFIRNIYDNIAAQSFLDTFKFVSQHEFLKQLLKNAENQQETIHQISSNMLLIKKVLGYKLPLETTKIIIKECIKKLSSINKFILSLEKMDKTLRNPSAKIFTELYKRTGDVSFILKFSFINLDLFRNNSTEIKHFLAAFLQLITKINFSLDYKRYFKSEPESININFVESVFVEENTIDTIVLTTRILNNTNSEIQYGTQAVKIVNYIIQIFSHNLKTRNLWLIETILDLKTCPIDDKLDYLSTFIATHDQKSKMQAIIHLLCQRGKEVNGKKLKNRLKKLDLKNLEAVHSFFSLSNMPHTVRKVIPAVIQELTFSTPLPNGKHAILIVVSDGFGGYGDFIFGLKLGRLIKDNSTGDAPPLVYLVTQPSGKSKIQQLKGDNEFDIEILSPDELGEKIRIQHIVIDIIFEGPAFKDELIENISLQLEDSKQAIKLVLIPEYGFNLPEKREAIKESYLYRLNHSHLFHTISIIFTGFNIANDESGVFITEVPKIYPSPQTLVTQLDRNVRLPLLRGITIEEYQQGTELSLQYSHDIYSENTSTPALDFLRLHYQSRILTSHHQDVIMIGRESYAKFTALEAIRNELISAGYTKISFIKTYRNFLNEKTVLDILSNKTEIDDTIINVSSGFFHIDPVSLAKGGWGEVFKAYYYYRESGRLYIKGPYAIKESHISESYINLESEMNFLSKAFPGLPFDLVKIKHYSYLIMPYFPGFPLDKYLKQNPAMPLDERLSIAYFLIKRLRSIHDSKVMHLDIKPANIIYDPIRKKVVIVDFGCASRESYFIKFRSLENAKFSIEAMPPEYLSGTSADPKTDIYSLAFTLACVMGLDMNLLVEKRMEQAFTVIKDNQLIENIRTTYQQTKSLDKALFSRLVSETAHESSLNEFISAYVKLYYDFSHFKGTISDNILNLLNQMQHSIPSDRPLLDKVIRVFRQEIKNLKINSESFEFAYLNPTTKLLTKALSEEKEISEVVLYDNGLPGKTYRVINARIMSHPSLLACFGLSSTLCGSTGDQSLIESLSFNKITLYECLEHKTQLIQDYYDAMRKVADKDNEILRIIDLLTAELTDDIISELSNLLKNPDLLGRIKACNATVMQTNNIRDKIMSEITMSHDLTKVITAPSSSPTFFKAELKESDSDIEKSPSLKPKK